MKKVYTVLQGKVTKSGSGDLCTQGKFESLEEAKVFFEKIKLDTKGWTNVKDGDTLQTVLEVDYLDEDGDIIDSEEVEYLPEEIIVGYPDGMLDIEEVPFN